MRIVRHRPRPSQVGTRESKEERRPEAEVGKSGISVQLPHNVIGTSKGLRTPVPLKESMYRARGQILLVADVPV